MPITYSKSNFGNAMHIFALFATIAFALALVTLCVLSLFR